MDRQLQYVGRWARWFDARHLTSSGPFVVSLSAMYLLEEGRLYCAALIPISVDSPADGEVGDKDGILSYNILNTRFIGQHQQHEAEGHLPESPFGLSLVRLELARDIGR